VEAGVLVRIPATLVALALGLALDGGTFALSRRLALDLAPIALLPLWALLAGLVAGRWALRPPPVPGLAVGLLLGAVQIGLAFGAVPAIRPYAEASLVMFQVMAAMSGGLAGLVVARRASQPRPEFGLTPLS
jgi:hypothetical protein